MDCLLTRLKSIAGFAVDTVYPRRCAGCGRRGSWVCPECEALYLPFAKPWCDRCGVPESGQGCKCSSTPASLDRVRSYGPLDGWLREAILQFKYESEWARADHLTQLVAGAIDALPAFDTLVPVPLHPARLRQRGFNQSQLLARQAGSLLQCAVDESLERTRRTQAQARLKGVDRAANVAEAFSVRQGTSLAGRNVVLVDDVITTGSTLAACAEALRNAGAASVSAATLAREL